MFKRILTFILALLLAACLVPALAEEDMPAQLYRIVLREETGDVTLGSGVLFTSSSVLLTTAGVWAEGDLYAIGADGEHAINYKGQVPGSQLITLGLATPAAAEPFTVTTADYLMDYNLYGVKADGSFVCMEVTASRNTAINNRAEVLLYAQEGLMPGAVMLGDDEGLACVTVYQMGEGEGVYAALADGTLAQLFGTQSISSGVTYDAGKQDVTTSSGDVRLLTGVTATVSDGLITVDWSASTGYQKTDDTVFTAYITVSDNTYLSSDEVENGETSAIFPAVPGAEVMAWVAVSQGKLTGHPYPETALEAAFVTVPEPEPFTLNGLKNIRMSVTPGEPGMDGVTADFLPQEPLTREALSDRSRPIYFQTEDTYTCDAEDDDHTLMVTLYTPEGYSFYYFSGYVFMPEYAQSDLWMSDISDVFADYERFCPDEPWPAGEYTVLYTIDGGEVARITFTLE